MSNALVAGFIPLLDCAPLVAAVECGFAAQEGLELTLIRETSWANIRDRIVVGHFDVAHMLGPMAIASTFGIGHLRVPMIVPFALGSGANAITVSADLWQQMSHHGATLGAAPATQGTALRQVIAMRAAVLRGPLTFAMVYPFSAQNYLLRYWLASAGIDPDRDVRLVVLPPPLLVDALKMGQVDGFCVGEPWNSLAVSASAGCIVATTSTLWRENPDKVIACRRDWAQRNPDRLQRLVRALYRAAQWCARSDHHQDLADMLAQPRYVGAPADILMRGLTNQVALVSSRPRQPIEAFYSAGASGENCPNPDHAAWYYSQMVRWRQVELSEELREVAANTFRADLYAEALSGISDAAATSMTDSRATNRFFDGYAFDARDLHGYLLKLMPT